MAQFENAYSRFVGTAKIVLPLLALALLSSVFLIAQDREPAPEISLSEAELEAMQSSIRVTSPSFSGVGGDGHTVTVRADAAYLDPENPNLAFVENLRANLHTLAGLDIELGAERGWYDSETNDVEFSGNVRAVTSSGYMIRSEQIIARQDGALIASPGAIRAQSPLGSVEAGAMELTRLADGAGYVLVFNSGVRLLYLPQTE